MCPNTYTQNNRSDDFACTPADYRNGSNKTSLVERARTL